MNVESPAAPAAVPPLLSARRPSGSPTRCPARFSSASSAPCWSPPSPVRAEFSEDFRQFLIRRYGRTKMAELERLDMGGMRMGSFGGRESPNERRANRPVVMIHGTTLRAGIFNQHRDFFMQNGYQPGELFATTYSDGGLSPLFAKKMECRDLDVNAPPQKYEGKTVYAIYTTTDQVVGQQCNGKQCSSIKNADLVIAKTGFDHLSILFLTKELQFSLFKYHISGGFYLSQPFPLTAPWIEAVGCSALRMHVDFK
ncbi:hypothetical protein M3Y99_00906000 [Aphelenchoides fujianensis]|nr:hypothetical protein M3Y99_00906000 [Aphelenchoides fujianensis]